MAIKSKTKERGIALVTVLLLLSAFSLLTAATIAIGLYAVLEVDSAGNRSRDHYRAEGALNRAIFLLRNDLTLYPDRTLGEHEYKGFFAKPRYLADGVEREMTIGEHSWQWRIWDASSGMAVEPAATLVQRLQEKREAEIEKINRTLAGDQEFSFFGERITDYIDADEFKALHGMESKDYRKQNRALLPRNGSFQFREELRFIDGFDERYPADARGIMNDFLVIPPVNMPAIPERHNLYSDDFETISRLTDLTESEETKVFEALTAWRSSGKLLRDSLTPALLSRLQKAFQVKESGFYRIEIDSNTPGGVHVTATLQLGAAAAKFQYYDLLFD